MLGGFMPALLWLWFWLREDSQHPEPRMLIALAFLAGMIAVGIVIYPEEFVAGILANQTYIFIAWAAIEELTKFAVAWLSVLRRKENDEPIDSVIYMVAVALGFGAAENTLFLLSPLSGLTTAQMIITGDYRFVGATLLHVFASSVIGIALALAFYRSRSVKMWFLLAGVILSITLHAIFNLLIMSTPTASLTHVFILVWLGLVGVLAILEFVKRIPARRMR